MADHLDAPSPLEEHRKLSVFAGEWDGEEMVFPSRWLWHQARQSPAGQACKTP